MNEVASLGALPGFHSENNSFRWDSWLRKKPFDELPTEGSAEHNVLHRSADCSCYVSLFLCERKENMHMWARVGVICKQKRTPWQSPPPVSGWCMRMWLRVNAWTRTQLQRNKTRVTHTHTHTHSLARTAVADVVRIEHLTLYQRVLKISFQLFLFQCIRLRLPMF